jgi:hypothetical protein
MRTFLAITALILMASGAMASDNDTTITYTLHSNALRIDVNDTTVTVYTVHSVELLPVSVRLPLCGELVSVTAKNGRVVDYHSRPQAGPFLMVVSLLMIVISIATRSKDWGAVGAIILLIGIALTALSV